MELCLSNQKSNALNPRSLLLIDTESLIYSWIKEAFFSILETKHGMERMVNGRASKQRTKMPPRKLVFPFPLKYCLNSSIKRRFFSIRSKPQNGKDGEEKRIEMHPISNRDGTPELQHR